MAVKTLTIDGNANASTVTGASLGVTNVAVSGATLQFTTARAPVGFTTAIRINSTASGTAYAYDTLATPSGQMATAYYVWIDALPASGSEISLFYTATDAPVRAFAIGLLSTGFVRLYDSANATIVTSNVQFPLGQWVRIEVAATQATGALRVAYFVGHGTTATWDSNSSPLTGKSLGANFTSFRWGKASTSAYVGTWDFSAVRYDPAVGTFIGPAPYNTVTTPPTTVMNVDNDWALIDFAGSAATQGGSLSYVITPALPSGSIALTGANAGKYFVPRGTSNVTYTGKSVESGSSSPNGPTKTVIVLAAGSAGNAVSEWQIAICTAPGVFA